MSCTNKHKELSNTKLNKYENFLEKRLKQHVLRKHPFIYGGFFCGNVFIFSVRNLMGKNVAEFSAGPRSEKKFNSENIMQQKLQANVS